MLTAMLINIDYHHLVQTKILRASSIAKLHHWQFKILMMCKAVLYCYLCTLLQSTVFNFFSQLAIGSVIWKSYHPELIHASLIG